MATSGRLWGLMGFLGLGSAVLWGSLSDRLGRRKAFVLSFSIYAAGLSLFWLVPVLAGFLAGVVLIGLSLRAGFTIFAAASGDYVPPHLSAAVFGTIGVGAGLGRSIFPPVGGSIADATGDLGWVFALAVTAAIGHTPRPCRVPGSLSVSRGPAHGTHPSRPAGLPPPALQPPQVAS